MKMKSVQAFVLATAAAALFNSGVVFAADTGATEAKIHCGGVNSCKGTSDCKTANNACKGQNGCKGQGFKELSAADCEAKGGKAM